MFILYFLFFTFVLSLCMLFYVILQVREMKKRPPAQFTPEWYLSDLGKRVRMNPIRRVMKKVFDAPRGSFISFGGGRPSPKVLPFESIKVKTKTDFEYTLEGSELEAGIQYGPASGLPQLINWLRDFTDKEHGKLPSSFDVIPGNGGNQLIFNMLDLIYNPGDVIASVSPVFCCAPHWAHLRNAELLPVTVTSDGLDIKQLKDICEKKPLKLLYLVTTGNNPCGVTMSETCRRAVYALAQRYNFLILSDDPYRFATGLPESRQLPSFLQLDIESSNPGRVIRIDSFSKILSPGARLGWMTAHKVFISKMRLMISTVMLSTSLLSQVVVWKFLDSHPNFDQHLKDISNFYETQRQTMVELLEKHFKPHGATWLKADAGFFVWLDLSKTTYQKQTTDAMEELIEAGVVCVPGIGFSATGTGFEHFVRLSYSEATIEDMKEGIPKLASVFFSKKQL